MKEEDLKKKGTTYRGFTVTNATEIKELKCWLIELSHDKTGANIIHIANDDPENVFCLSFQTLPQTSNGVAHILEHTVLCGSKKFPVKDPFFAMNRRSLNTFMNAFTGADFTCYPAASQVKKDFYNLLDVYLDSVFQPLLNELSFKQEGWRLEFSDPQNKSSPLEFKGIVFNEMKGALANPTSRLVEELNKSLFPDLTYGVNSGGDPKVIPKLTFQEFLEFYQSYYHPSRTVFFFYGNFPLTGHLDFLESELLSKINKIKPLPPLPSQKRFEKPVRRRAPYPIASEENLQGKTIIAQGWLTCHILELQDLLALSVIETILMDTDASPLKLALLKSGLTKQASGYLDEEISEIPFVLILQGCEEGNGKAIEELIEKTLKEIVKNGIPPHLIENAIHQIELAKSEISGHSYPYGLSLFFRSALFKQHGGNPEYGLTIHSLFDQLRERLKKNPKLLEKLIEKYLIQNPHKVQITLVPDPELGKREEEEEKKRLSEIKESLTEEKKQKIQEEAKNLSLFQKMQEDTNLDVLPKVTLADVPKESRDYPLKRSQVGSLNVFHHATFTNTLLYVDLIFNLPSLSEEELPYVRLFGDLVDQVGCGGRDYIQNLEYIQAHTGGVSASLYLNQNASNSDIFSPSLHLRGKSLSRKSKELFGLIKEMTSSLDFSDTKRIKELIMKTHTGLESNIIRNALKYATNLAASGLDVPSKIANEWWGLEYFWFIRDLAKNFEKHLPQLLEKFAKFQKELLKGEKVDLVISSEEEDFNHLLKEKFYGLADIPSEMRPPWNLKPSLQPVPSQARIIGSPVAFTTMIFKALPYTHEDAPALSLAAFIFDNTTLHPRIREQGGAYGSGAVNSPLSSQFYFYAYRDPNIVTSLQAFEEAVHLGVNGNFGKERLDEAKLEMVQALDAPISPGSRAINAYIWEKEGRDLKTRQAFRDKILSMDLKTIQEAVKKHILPKLEKNTLVIFGGKEMIEAENEILKEKGKGLEKIEII